MKKVSYEGDTLVRLAFFDFSEALKLLQADQPLLASFDAELMGRDSLDSEAQTFVDDAGASLTRVSSKLGRDLLLPRVQVFPVRHEDDLTGQSGAGEFTWNYDFRQVPKGSEKHFPVQQLVTEA